MTIEARFPKTLNSFESAGVKLVPPEQQIAQPLVLAAVTAPAGLVAFHVQFAPRHEALVHWSGVKKLKVPAIAGEWQAATATQAMKHPDMNRVNRPVLAGPNSGQFDLNL
jgi:hypothetical protein